MLGNRHMEAFHVEENSLGWLVALKQKVSQANQIADLDVQPLKKNLNLEHDREDELTCSEVNCDNRLTGFLATEMNLEPRDGYTIKEKLHIIGYVQPLGKLEPRSVINASSLKSKVQLGNWCHRKTKGNLEHTPTWLIVLSRRYKREDPSFDVLSETISQFEE